MATRPAGSFTRAGVPLLPPVAPLPSCPSVLSPQASALPLPVRARLLRWPAATAVTLAPAGSLTGMGMSLSGTLNRLVRAYADDGGMPGQAPGRDARPGRRHRGAAPGRVRLRARAAGPGGDADL